MKEVMAEMPEGSKPTVNVCVRKITFQDGVGGMERAASRHIEMMLSTGMKVRLFTPSPNGLKGDIPRLVELHTVPWPKFPSRGGNYTFGLAYFLWVARLRRHLQEVVNPGEIVHLHGGTAGVLSGQNFSENATIVNPHGMEEFGDFSFQQIANRLALRPLARRGRYANAVVATDESLRPKVLKNIGCREENVVTIPNAVDVPGLLSLIEPDSSEYREHFRIVTVGRIVANKGYDLLAEALSLPSVKSSIPSGWSWTHFGSGPEKGNLENLALRRGVPLHIEVDANDRHVQTALAKASLFVQPSRYEGSSLTTLEAMAHARIVVATPAGGIPDKIVNGKTGYLASEISAAALGRALVQAIQGADTGQDAHSLVCDMFSVVSETDSYVRLYGALDARTDSIES